MAPEAVFTPEGEAALEENLKYYRNNARILSEMLTSVGVRHTGGKNAPYIWMECGVEGKEILDSWTFFERLLREEGIVGTPGEGFGKEGKGWFRLTAFSTLENTLEAAKRMERFFKGM